MPNPNYRRGYNLEKRAQAMLVELGECVRSFGSRGADLILTRHLRQWKFSCKQRKKNNPLSLNKIRAELETHDFVIVGEDRQIPLVIGLLPKSVEFSKDENEMGGEVL